MSDAEDDPPPPTSPDPPPSSSSSSPSSDEQRVISAVQSLSQILSSPSPESSQILSSPDPARSLLTDPSLSSSLLRRLRLPSSGSGDDHLCRWLYDAFQSSLPSLQLVVLRFLPSLSGLYLSRCSARRHHHAGFEAVLLALYAHQTLSRQNQPLLLHLPNPNLLPSPYHSSAPSSKPPPPPPPSKENKTASTSTKDTGSASAAATVVLSEPLQPHGTVRATKRARIVGVALELYYDRISEMPTESKIEFCGFAAAWAGYYGASTSTGDGEGEEKKGRRAPLPMELMRPVLRIVGHCLLGQPGWGGGGGGEEELRRAAVAAARGLYERALHDMDAEIVLATRSLVRVGSMDSEIMFRPPEMPSVYSSAAAATPTS